MARAEPATAIRPCHRLSRTLLGPDRADVSGPAPPGGRFSRPRTQQQTGSAVSLEAFRPRSGRRRGSAQRPRCDRSRALHGRPFASSLRRFGPRPMRRCLLVDPTIFSPEATERSRADASFILRRRTVWSSPEQMFERFHARLPFSRWQPEVLRDYCRLRRTAERRRIRAGVPARGRGVDLPSIESPGIESLCRNRRRLRSP